MRSDSCSMTRGTCDPAQVNVGSDERQLSLIAGATILVGGTLLASTRSFLVAAVGLGLIYRGMTGHCLGYDALGISTAEESTPRGVTSEVPVGAT